MKEHDIFTMTEDINPVIQKGMKGTIIHIYSTKKKKDIILAEFIDGDGDAITYRGHEVVKVPVNSFQLNQSNTGTEK